MVGLSIVEGTATSTRTGGLIMRPRMLLLALLAFAWAALGALKHADRNGNGTIELSGLVSHIQDQVPAMQSATIEGEPLLPGAVKMTTCPPGARTTTSLLP